MSKKKVDENQITIFEVIDASAKPEKSKTKKKTSSAKKAQTGKKAAPESKKQASGSTAKKKTEPKKSAPKKKPAKASTKQVAVQPGISRKKKAEAPRKAQRPQLERKAGVRRASKKPVANTRRKHRKKVDPRMARRTAVANMLLLTGIAAMCALTAMLVFRHNMFLEMKAAVEAQTFYDGTTVEGVDVSGRTLQAALDYWQQHVEPAYADRKVQIGDDKVLTAVDFGYKSDYDAVLSAAWSAGRRGSLEQRYRAVVRREAHPVAYDVDRTLYDDAAIDSYIQTLAESVDRPAVNARIESFDAQNYTFVFTESAEGRRLDAEGLKQQIVSALGSGGGSATPVVETVHPDITTDDVSSRYGMITYAVTNASTSSSNRLNNIKQAMSFIDGKRLAPGEEFSFNDTVGKRTRERGFRVATAYSSGTVTEELGGGICQVSTTLFNAAVKADLQILERHNHSLTVHYVDEGKDATVNWGSQDLRFRNTTDEDIYISCMLSEDKRVRFAIFGKLPENGETITVETKVTQTIKYETQYRATPELAPGAYQVVEKGKNGCKAEAYKVRWDANGNEISRELLCKSTYKSTPQLVAIGQ